MTQRARRPQLLIVARAPGVWRYRQNYRALRVVHELPDNDHHCHKDSAALKIIGEEVIEKLHGLPARIEVTRHVRRKYACPTCEEGMKTAPRRRPSCFA
ncbi:hypothetical protein HAALTHF_53900n [Vreelandella aquamarina]|nr:hypothetical protein HAALTHF_53900n [Halomonas axialensis]